MGAPDMFTDLQLPPGFRLRIDYDRTMGPLSVTVTAYRDGEWLGERSVAPEAFAHERSLREIVSELLERGTRRRSVEFTSLRDRWMAFVQVLEQKMAALGEDPALVLHADQSRLRIRALVGTPSGEARYFSRTVSVRHLENLPADQLADAFIVLWQARRAKPKRK